MRCTQCGFPLSPTRNSCPRCGTPVNTPSPARVEGPPSSAGAFSPQVPFPAPQQLSFEQEPSMPISESTQQPNVPASYPPMQQPNVPASYPINNDLPNRSSGRPTPQQPHSSTRRSSTTTTIGLTSAGLCIIAGSLLLVFVYLVGQGVFPTGTTPASDTQQSNIVKANQTATATYLSKPTPEATATPTLPGQGLLDLAVLSNDFNSTQPLTDFKVNQTIYVVLSLHPGGNSHTVCLDWHLNGQSVKTYAFEVNPTYYNYHYYSYTIMTTAGSGYVDISLASTAVTNTNCTDATMAKILNFTVSE